MEERRPLSQTSTAKNFASSMLKSLVDGLTKPRSNVPGDKRVNKLEDYVGSNPTPLTKLRFPKLSWAEDVGLPECPYFRRWVIDFGAFSLRLHRWNGSDDDRAFHDHAWWFVTLVLWGAYKDVSDQGEDLLTPGSIRFRPAAHKHTVQILKPGTWTLLVTGPVIRRWGFWVKDKLWKRDKYFATRGHHPCSPGQPPVRRRPDGSRI